MTRLLVSVRNAQEAELAVQAGVDLIDIKEPTRGALGPADFGQMAAVVERVGNARPTSAALGELLALREPARLPRQLCYVKVGLAGCAAREWQPAFKRFSDALSPGIAMIAVAYADWQAAQSPPPEEVSRSAAELGCRGVLLDTFDKRGGSLLDHFDTSRLRRWLEELRTRELISVVAGGLSLDVVSHVASFAPDFVGVRGAACRGGRTGSLDVRCVGRLQRTLRGTAIRGRALETTDLRQNS